MHILIQYVVLGVVSCTAELCLKDLKTSEISSADQACYCRVNWRSQADVCV